MQCPTLYIALVGVLSHIHVLTCMYRYGYLNTINFETKNFEGPNDVKLLVSISANASQSSQWISLSLQLSKVFTACTCKVANVFFHLLKRLFQHNNSVKSWCEKFNQVRGPAQLVIAMLVLLWVQGLEYIRWGDFRTRKCAHVLILGKTTCFTVLQMHG